jgi:hypothetical protein
MVNTMLIVGSSIEMPGIASGFSGSTMVSPISKFSKPKMAQISPASTVVDFHLSKAFKYKQVFNFIFNKAAVFF